MKSLYRAIRKKKKKSEKAEEEKNPQLQSKKNF